MGQVGTFFRPNPMVRVVNFVNQNKTNQTQPNHKFFGLLEWFIQIFIFNKNKILIRKLSIYIFSNT